MARRQRRLSHGAAPDRTSTGGCRTGSPTQSAPASGNCSPIPARWCLPNSTASRPGQQKILDAVETAVGGSSLAEPRDSVAPLVTASLLVPDDLCLMERDGDSYRLTAACVCSPSYWLLATEDRPHAGRHPRPRADAERQSSGHDAAVLRALTRGRGIRTAQLAAAHEPGAVPAPLGGVAHVTAAGRGSAGDPFRTPNAAPPRFATVVFTIRVTCHPLSEDRWISGSRPRSGCAL